MAAAVGHGELASGQDAQADRTPLCLLSIRPIRRALAAYTHRKGDAHTSFKIVYDQKSCAKIKVFKGGGCVYILELMRRTVYADDQSNLEKHNNNAV